MVRLKCGYYNGIDIGAGGSKGGLSLGWNGNDLVSIRSYSSYHVDAIIHDPDNGVAWRLMGFYSSLDERYRWASWDLLYPTNEILGEILEVQLGLNFEADKEEVFWAQHARLNWFRYGDRDSSFFHRVAVARHNRNRILGLEDDSSQWVMGTEDMKRIAVKNFKNLFTASDVGGDDRWILNIPLVGRGSSDMVVWRHDTSGEYSVKSGYRDFEGQIMGACTYPLLDVADAFVAEARACERALYFALDIGFRKVILEDVTYIFVPREANKAAHELAMVGRNQKLPCFWVEEAPSSVIEVVESDRYEWFHRC
ncbi:hypothetical protein GOBAR_DD01549 [Gossypium barbadense]|nr:hypothetical protein GOBAR_DD01549 [Gossypium barbadense]